MNAVERVKEICKERNIPIYTLEKECGFSNGYIRKLSKGTFPNDRLTAIAKYLNVSESYLTTGKEVEKESDSGKKWYFSDETAEIAEELFEKPRLRVLMDASRKASPEAVEAVITLITAQLEKEQGDGYAE